MNMFTKIYLFIESNTRITEILCISHCRHPETVCRYSQWYCLEININDTRRTVTLPSNICHYGPIQCKIIILYTERCTHCAMHVCSSSGMERNSTISIDIRRTMISHLKVSFICKCSRYPLSTTAHQPFCYHFGFDEHIKFSLFRPLVIFGNPLNHSHGNFLCWRIDQHIISHLVFYLYNFLKQKNIQTHFRFIFMKYLIGAVIIHIAWWKINIIWFYSYFSKLILRNDNLILRNCRWLCFCVQ